ncbi:MAG: NADPH:quinone reductase [Ignavibacteriales bacterium]
MKAAYIDKPGPPENIQFGNLPMPVLHEHEVLVRVRAVTVNHVDTFIRSGAFQTNIPLPFIIGRDMVGIVETVGSGVRQFKAGEYVWSNCLGIEGHQGTFAEYAGAPENRLYHLPPGVEPNEAVAVVHSALTAVIGLFTKARITAGDTLFINGGSGSVGLSVLQIAKSCGARVAVTAGDEQKAKLCLEMGADRVVNYHKENVLSAIREFAPEGIDIFWESTREFDPEKIIPVMADHGRIVVIAGRNRQCNFPIWPFYTRNCSIYGFIVTGTGIEELKRYSRQINAWLANGTLKANIHEIMPLSKASQAHKLQEQGHLPGKIVLVPEM